jgi:hypothetical protein
VINIIRLDRSRVLGAALLAASAVTAPMMPAGAHTINSLPPSACNFNNCSAALIFGSITSHGSFSIPWEAQVGAIAGECLRLETTTADSDLEIVAISPSGQVFSNDNGGAGNLSLVKIAPAESGWYTVRVARSNGTAAAENFILRYGRYTSASNPNCASPTPPR